MLSDLLLMTEEAVAFNLAQASVCFIFKIRKTEL